MLRGQCPCGAVRVEIRSGARPPTVCHCSRCRRWHGAFGAYTSAPTDKYGIEGMEHVRWNASSARAEQGFCGQCGAKLFWREKGAAALDVVLGMLDQPTGLSLGAHIWVASKGDYYRIDDGVPCYPESAGKAQPIAEPELPGTPRQGVLTGRCLCGEVSYGLTGAVREVVTCHCGQCRRWHGHFAPFAASRIKDIELRGERELRWYASSDQARRGFCGRCGSSLFWARGDADRWSIAAGTLNPPTGLKTVRHIFTADKGDSYKIGDGVRQMPGSSTSDPVSF